MTRLVVDVVIPALNEAEALPHVLRELPRESLRRVVVADNGSDDGTAAVARRHGAEVVFEGRRGYGAACLRGLSALAADPPDVVVFLDGDHSDHPAELPLLLAPIEAGEADLVVGSRTRGRATRGALTPQQRIGNGIACLVLRWLYDAWYTDLGPFRAIRWAALERLRMSDRDYGWPIEMQVKAARAGLRHAEVPVSYRLRIGRSKISGTVRGVLGASRKILWVLARHAAAAPMLSVCPGPSRGMSAGARAALETLLAARLVPGTVRSMASELDDRFQTLHEIVRAARRALAPGPWDYLVGGAETETTLKRNRQALDALAFRPRVLRDVSARDATAEFLARRIRLPVFVAPIGSIETFTPGGGATAARGAARFGVPLMLSSVCNPGLEATAEAADSVRVFQLYVRGDDAWVDDHVRRAVDHGYRAFCLTVDTAVYSRRERDLARRFVKPWRARATGTEYQAALSWDQVKRFKDAHDVPLILKGIATAEDAEIACDHGVDAIYVSNHGGRQLDHGRGSLAVLPEVVGAVRGRARVWVDGGFVRGTDIVKAIALGASAAGLGRIACMGLAAAGEAGLERVLELLEDEVRVAMGLLGVTRLADLDPSYLHPAEPVTPPSVTSAFPLLGLDVAEEDHPS